MEAVEFVRTAGHFDVLVGGCSMSMSPAEINRSKLLNQTVAASNPPKKSLRLPSGYLEAWLGYIRQPAQGTTLMRGLDTTVKMLNAADFFGDDLAVNQLCKYLGQLLFQPASEVLDELFDERQGQFSAAPGKIMSHGSSKDLLASQHGSSKDLLGPKPSKKDIQVSGSLLSDHGDGNSASLEHRSSTLSSGRSSQSKGLNTQKSAHSSALPLIAGHVASMPDMLRSKSALQRGQSTSSSSMQSLQVRVGSGITQGTRDGSQSVVGATPEHEVMSQSTPYSDALEPSSPGLPANFSSSPVQPFWMKDVGTTQDLELHLGSLGNGLDSPTESPSFAHSQSFMLHTLRTDSFMSSALESNCHSQHISRSDTQMSTIIEECGMQRKLQVLEQLPSQLLVAVIRASDVGVCRCLEALPEAVHPLALRAHYPELASHSTLAVNTTSLRSTSDAPLTVGRASRTIQKILKAAAQFEDLQELQITASTRPSWSEPMVSCYSYALAHLQDLTSLSLSGGLCTPPVVAATAAALPTFFSLRSFSIHACEAPKRETLNSNKSHIGSWKLYEALQVCNQLEELCFSGVAPECKDSSGHSYLVYALTRLSGLRSLTLKNGSVTPEQMKLLQMNLETSPQSSWMSGLLALDLSSNSLGGSQGTKALASLLPHFTSLQKLNFSHNALTPDSLKALAPPMKHLQELRHLDLAGNKIGAAGSSALASAWLRLSRLEHISMNACRMPAAATISIAHAVAKYPNLLHLDLRGCSLAGGEHGIAGAQVLAQSLQKHTPATLQHFYHEDSGLRPVSARLLFRSLGQHMGLKSLHVRCVFLYDQYDDSLKEIAWHLHRLTNLEHLRFSCDKLSPSEAEALNSAFCSLKGLTSLNLSHLWLGDAPLEFLSFIFKMKALAELDLSACNLPQFHSAQVLARILPKALSLQTLRLSKNPLADDSAQALAAVLPSLTALQQIALTGTDITNAGANAIITVLDSHVSMTSCDLRDNIFVQRKLLPAVQRKGWLHMGRL